MKHLVYLYGVVYSFMFPLKALLFNLQPGINLDHIENNQSSCLCVSVCVITVLYVYCLMWAIICNLHALEHVQLYKAY